MEGQRASDYVAAGEAALAEADWERAAGAFSAAVAVDASPVALDGLARAHWWMGETAVAVELRERAFAGFQSGEEMGRASRVALWLAEEHETGTGNVAAANGWRRRAETLLRDLPDGPEAGWLALLGAGRDAEPADIEAGAERGLAAARRHGDVDLEIRSLSRLGLALIEQSKIDAGIDRLDEALVTATSASAVMLETIGEAYCDAFAAIEIMGDDRRLAQWSDIIIRFMRRYGYGPVIAFCGACCGELFAASGDIAGAERELVAALEKLDAASAPARCSHPAAKLAELRVLQGRYEQAERLLATYGGVAETVRAEAGLAMASGRPAAAADLLRRRVDALGEREVRAVPYLVDLVAAALAAGDVDAARDASARLDAVVAATGLAAQRAQATAARGRVALAEGGIDEGLGLLEDALTTFTEQRRRLDAARVRLLIAEGRAAVDAAGAEAEARRALHALEQLGARRDDDRAAALLRDLGAGSAPGPRGADVLTRRERQVLALLGEGLTNAEIAERLFIARKTADHHVSRILTKLGVRNRAEAAVHALRRGDGITG